jgi:flagellar basal body P-ring formation protein FlgA
MRAVTLLAFLSRILLPVCLLPTLASAATQPIWHAARTLRPGDIVQDDDVVARPPLRPVIGGLSADQPLAGLEMRRYVATGRPLTDRDVGPRMSVRANTDVRMIWQATGIRLEMIGRALEGAAPGNTVRVLNTSSSRTVRGIAQEDGSVLADPSQ